MRKTDAWRLARIGEICRQLVAVVDEGNITEDAIMNDLHTQWMITTPLYRIGEQAYGLSRDYKDAHPEVPWGAIAGLRHRLVHDYEGTNWRFVAEAVLVEVPGLLAQVERLLSETQ